MDVPRYWRLRRQRYALSGEVCNHCGAKLFPPRPVCPFCGGVVGSDASLHLEDECLPLPVDQKVPVIIQQKRG